MNQVITTRTVRTYAEPLAGLRVSWGAVLAGAISLLGVSLLLWALALAIVLTSSQATAHSARADVLALWICAMGTTVLGAIAGGYLAGLLPGNARASIGAAHGFLAWVVAFVFAFVLSVAGIGSLFRAGLMASTRLVGPEAQVAQAASAGPAERAETVAMLESLGYTPAQAEAILRQAGASQRMNVMDPYRLRSTANVMLDWGAGLAWSWFGTWAVAAIAASAAGAGATRRLRSIEIAKERVTTPPGVWTPEPSVSQ